MLVHCKMGISRSATVTIAYVMKEYGHSLAEALDHVRGRREIVRPNKAGVNDEQPCVARP